MPVNPEAKVDAIDPNNPSWFECPNCRNTTFRIEEQKARDGPETVTVHYVVCDCCQLKICTYEKTIIDLLLEIKGMLRKA